MKTLMCVAGVAVLTLIETGCYTAPPPPAATVQPIAPAPTGYPSYAPEPYAPAPPTGYYAYAPEYYTWDGNEYVGVSNGQYVYYSGGVWLAAPPIVIGRFNGWARYHPDWRRHATPYHHEHFR